MRLKRVTAAAVAIASLGSVPSAGAQDGAPLVRMRDGHGSDLLFRLDARTLQQVGRPIRTFRNGAALAFSADGTRIAYAGGGPRRSGIQFVDLAAWRSLGTRRIASRQGPLELGWVSDERVVALMGDWDGNRRAVWIDVATRRVLARRSFKGLSMGTLPVPGGVAVAVAPHEGVGPLRILLLDAIGGMRTIELDGISAGSDHDPRRGEILTPGVTVDRDSGRLYAIAARGQLVAEVDLASGAVSYHSLGASASKGNVAVWWRTAVWAGDGKIAVTGQRWPRRGRRRLPHGPVPLGLRVIDTADWSIRTLDPRPHSVHVAGDTFLAAGTRFFDGGRRTESTGLLAFDDAGRRVFTRFRGRPVALLGSRGGLGYAWIRRTRTAYVIDLRDGRTVNEVRTGNRIPFLLIPPG